MVAAGATVLMAASEESSSDGIENTTLHCDNHSRRTRSNQIQRSQDKAECSTRKSLLSFSPGIKEKKILQMLDKNSRLPSKVESRDGPKNLSTYKTTPIRETKASRLRAASITSPTGSGVTISKKLGSPDCSTSWNLQPSTSLSNKEDSSLSSDNGSTMNTSTVKERDRSNKRKSYLSRISSTDGTHGERPSHSDYRERRSRRQSDKPGHISQIISNRESSIYRQTISSSQKKNVESRTVTQRSPSYHSSRSRSQTSSVSPSTNMKYSCTQRTSGDGQSDSEVSRRVDALTALTKATIERVERLTSNTNSSTSQGSDTDCSSLNNTTGNHTCNSISVIPTSPNKYSILKRANEEPILENCSVRGSNLPVSILKHKDTESGQSSSNSSHQTLPVTFSPSVIEPTRNSKRHGILKKRSSLDENEILRRRSCSPDVSFIDNSGCEFRPILKNQRRSSLDEIVKRGQSPDPQPTSILKRKSSREDDNDDRLIGSPEPQGILKRKSGNVARAVSANNYIAVLTDISAVNICDTESSEVKPILKKKYVREESCSSDPPSLEPRPILKKKSSTDSDEHDDKPKKTILKCSRKSSREDDNSCDVEIGSPKKLSMLRNRILQFRSGSIETDVVRPILKQHGLRDNESRVRLNVGNVNTSDEVHTSGEDIFLRKRAQSVGHVQTTDINNEISSMLGKRSLLGSTLAKDKIDYALNSKSMQQNCEETNCVVTNSSEATCNSVTSSKKTQHETHDIDKLVCSRKAEDTREDESTTVSINKDSKDNNLSNRMTDNSEVASHSMLSANENEGHSQEWDSKENYEVHRSNSVSKIAMHFKSLQEKAKAAAERNSVQNVRRKASHGVQKYRDRKEQDKERFNTQPVTYQEVQEAVLQNQRNAACNRNDSTGENNNPSEEEFDPSKLSLAERIKMFNQKVATKETTLSDRSTHGRRRPGTRYRTQPVTSEEMEVASRMTPLHDLTKIPNNIGLPQDSQILSTSQLSSTSLHELPKSILKSTTSHTCNVPRSKSPELEGIKLIKSVLKKESEELQRQISESCDIFPRSILKSNSLKSEGGNFNVTSGTQADSAIDVVDNGEIHSHCAYDIDKSDHKNDPQNETEQRFTVPSNKNISQDQLNKSRTNEHSIDADNARSIVTNAYIKKYLKTDKGPSSDGTPRTSDDETSFIGNCEVHGVIKNEAVHRRRQATLAKQTRYTALSKSASHHALSNDSGLLGSTVHKPNAIPLPGLCRSATQTMPNEDANENTTMSIAERLAALQRSGDTNWRKRVTTESYTVSKNSSTENDGHIFSKEEMAIRQGVLASCLGKLETATEGWKKRITASDVQKFSVAGKMKLENNDISETSSPLIEVTGSSVTKEKKIPRLERFKGRKGYTKDIKSMPTSPNKESRIKIQGSYSEPTSDESGEEAKPGNSSIVSVPKADDESFTSFFNSIAVDKCKTECISVEERDFDDITSHIELLVQKRNIQAQRRRVASRNPLKALAARTDLKSEYSEVRTEIADKMMKSINVNKLAKNSTLAVEALAGLASTEDFSAVTLRNAAETDITVNKLRPYKDLMLILIKGRRHVQVRLIEPVAENINSGDNFVLVTKSEVYNYIGKFSNVIEKARGAEIALSIMQNKDLGCQASQVVIISEDKITCTKNQLQTFWNHLGVKKEKIEVVDGGHPDEDEIYESAIIDTNMVYEIKDDELVPLEKYWGAVPKIKILDPSKVLVFDFGSEMYIWSGKGASNEKKKLATKLATELWEEGYDYTDCKICPLHAASLLGRRNKLEIGVKKANDRPKWCLLAKLTQHVETILFREKFLDWPNVSGIIKIKGKLSDDREQVDGSIIVEPCDVKDMIAPNTTPVDLILEGCHLGRGTGWYDDELMRQYIVTTTNVSVWHIDEFAHTLLENTSVGQFYAGDSYIVRWMYSVTITGRELNGQPSKHSAKGRDRSAYFIWQGQNASLNEQGTAALLTIELDNDKGPQIRVDQGSEPAAFLNLFSGKMIIHSGKKSEKRPNNQWRLYVLRGTLKSETSLLEVTCSTRQLRSRGSFILLNSENGKLYIWHGTNSSPHIQENALHAALFLKNNRPSEVGLSEQSNVEIEKIDENKEPKEFFNALGGINRKLYNQLGKDQMQNYTPRLFHLTSVFKKLEKFELLCPHRANLSTPFPFLQDELYKVNQPALFLVDNKTEIWIWQGWWPDSGAEDQSGSKAVRWQAEKRAAMTVAMEYWFGTHSETTKPSIYLVWAGLEPLQFINLFPTWRDRDDIAEFNIEVGRNIGEILSVENELARLTKSTYPPAQLLQRPLPEGVDPTRLELYLSAQHFKELLGMSQEEFQELPIWKQVNLKKEIGLF